MLIHYSFYLSYNVLAALRSLYYRGNLSDKFTCLNIYLISHSLIWQGTWHCPGNAEFHYSDQYIYRPRILFMYFYFLSLKRFYVHESVLFTLKMNGHLQKRKLEIIFFLLCTISFQDVSDHGSAQPPIPFHS